MKLLASLLLLLCLSHASRADGAPCSRIISLAPSVTEVLFELGLGDRMVGVSKFCRYPPEARALPQVGGLYDTSLETLLSLKPTYIFGLQENSDALDSATRFGIRTLSVDHTSIDGIKQSIRAIASACDVQDKGDSQLAQLEERERAIRGTAQRLPPWRALVVVGRTHEGNTLSGLYISGKDGFYTGILHLLGLENVNGDRTIALPMVSPEGVMALSPEVIIEIVNVDDVGAARAVPEMWQRYTQLPAVKNNRIVVLSDDYASIPGPRYIRVAEDIAQRLTSGRAG